MVKCYNIFYIILHVHKQIESKKNKKSANKNFLYVILLYKVVEIIWSNWIKTNTEKNYLFFTKVLKNHIWIYVIIVSVIYVYKDTINVYIPSSKIKVRRKEIMSVNL